MAMFARDKRWRSAPDTGPGPRSYSPPFGARLTFGRRWSTELQKARPQRAYRACGGRESVANARAFLLDKRRRLPDNQKERTPTQLGKGATGTVTVGWFGNSGGRQACQHCAAAVFGTRANDKAVFATAGAQLGPVAPVRLRAYYNSGLRQDVQRRSPGHGPFAVNAPCALT